MRKLLYALLILIFINIPSWATTYYVSTTDGNDGNNGLAQTDEGGGVGPWLTKAKVNSDVSGSGDDVYFNRGNTWIDSTNLTQDWTGTSEDWTEIGAYGTGAKPIIENNSGGYTLEIDDNTVDYVSFLDLDLRSGTTSTVRVRYVDNILVDRCDITQTNGAGNVARFQTCTYLEVRYSTITWDATLEASSDDKEGIYLNPVDYANLHHNIINGAPHDGVNVGDGSDFVWIHDNEIMAPDRGFSHAIGFHGTYNFAYRNYIHDNRGSIQSSDGQYHYFYNNVVINQQNCCGGVGEGYGDCPENYELSDGSCDDGATQTQRGMGYNIQEDVSNVDLLNNYFGNVAEAAIRFYGSTMTPDTFRAINNIFNDCGMANEQSDEPPGSGSTWQDYTIAINNNFDNTEQAWDIRTNISYPITKNRVPPADDVYYKPADNVAAGDRPWQIPTDGGNTEFNSADTSVPFNNLTASGNFTADPDVGTYGTLNVGSPAIGAGLTLTTIPNTITDGDIDDAIDYSVTDFTDFVNTVGIAPHTVPPNIGPFGNNATAGWTGKIGGVTNPAKVMGIDVEDVNSINQIGGP